MIYASWDIEHNRQNFLVILDPFLPFYKPNNPKNQSFEKMENSPGGIIILNMCTINDNHMMYGSWDTERDRPNFLLFWTIICTFTPLTIQKIKILKKWKSAKRNYHFTQVYQNHDHIPDCSWEMVCDTCNCYFSFWAIFCTFTPLAARKIKILKKWKKHLKIPSFYIRAPKIMIRWRTVPDIWCATDGRTDRWTVKKTYRGGCPT